MALVPGSSSVDAVVPFAMEGIAVHGDGGKLGVGDLDAGLVGIFVERGPHAQSLLGGHGADQTDQHLPVPGGQ